MSALLRQWAKTAAILLAIGVSTVIIIWVHAGTPNIADLQVEEALMAPLPRPNYAEVAHARFTPARPPLWHTARYGVARIEIEVPDPSKGRIALFTVRARDNYAVYVNGALASHAPGRLGERPTAHGIHPRLVELLPAQLVAGRNVIDILGATNSTFATVNYVYVGPLERLEPAHRHLMALVYDTSLLATISAGMVFLFVLALSSVIRKPALLIATALVLCLTFINELQGLWVDAPWPYHNVRLMVVGTPLWIACAAFANEWTGGPTSYRKWFFAIAAASATAVIALFAVFSGPQASIATSAYQTVVGGCALIFMIQRMVRHYYAAPASAAAEVFVACTGLIMAVTLLVTQAVPMLVPAVMPIIVGMQGEAFAKFGTISLVGFIAVGLARNGVTIYRQAALSNEALQRQIQEKEQELEANYVMLHERERERAVNAERSRIMRDVHDGIGSQLQSLLAKTRTQVSDGETLTTGLQAAVDDLYLVVDSLDDVHGSLDAALATFRTRIEPKCTAAGIDIVWQIDDIGATKVLGPATVLQLYRILQEALSNAIRHGKPKRVTFTLRHDTPSGRIALALQDDGAGFDVAASATGRGLANMRRRAASIGAELDVTSGANGTSVKITLPA